MTRFLLLSDPRSGSTLLANLLNTHPDIAVSGELLNEDEYEIPQGSANILSYLQEEMTKLRKKSVGIKVFPCQIFKKGLTLEQIVSHLGITHIIVLWRQNFLESLVSKQIAEETGEWYKSAADESITLNKTKLEVENIQRTFEETLNDWEQIGQQWSIHVPPIFLSYENLVKNQAEECNKILRALSCKQIGHQLKSYSQRQNPKSLPEKVVNWEDIPTEWQNLNLHVDQILIPRMEERIGISEEIISAFVPDREPPPPADGWRYRVAEPYMPSGLKENVYDAIEFGTVSSAGHWVEKMALRLKVIYGVPVALPCSNGFTALFLALQTGGIGSGDEVIVPSLTMVAVPNSVHWLGATPIFADSSPNNYNPGWDEIAKVATAKTKAVIVTHTYGVPVAPSELQRIVHECKKNNWILIEDISECVGVKTAQDGQLLGTFGDYACASLYANKIVHGGDGGFVIAKDPSSAYRLKSLANHGFTPSYHFVHYEKAINGKINGIGAAMAAGCLDALPFIMKKRAELAEHYRNCLGGIPLKLMPSCGMGDTPWVFGVECKTKAERTKLRAFLATHGIETRDYFFPLHLQPAYATNTRVKLPNAEKFGSTGFYLPTFTNLRSEDIEFISGAIRAFYGLSAHGQDLQPPPRKMHKERILVKPGTFEVGVQSMDDAGGVKAVRSRGHPLSRAVVLGMEIQQWLLDERWDAGQILLKDIQTCLDEITAAETKIELEKYWSPYINYIKGQSSNSLEATATARPWTVEDLNAKEYTDALNIKTTSDPETLQLLMWLVKTKKPGVIWEIGCWVGHTTARLAIASEGKSKIYACDAFKWQKWMEEFLVMFKPMSPGDSFLHRFEYHTEPWAKSIVPVLWPYDITSLPVPMQSECPELVFIDMSQEDEDLELIWSITVGSFIPGKTILVFNGLNRNSLPFFTRHAQELQPLAKPQTIAKAFLYVNPKTDDVDAEPTLQILPRKFKFHSSPSWNHHHQNAFQVCIDLLKEELHDESATTLFVPAVEETFSDNPEILISGSWIGIIHSVQSHPEHFYAPDLRRLCSQSYAKAMELCKGLFTLTQFQANYLRENLNLAVKIPIQPIKYPIIPSTLNAALPSQVPTLWKEGIDFLLVGGFARDFELFFQCQIPSNLRKVLLAGEWEGEIHSQCAPPNVKILSRLNDQDYEKALQNSIVFLPLKYEGAANTIILECIERNVPIVVPRISSCTEYIGQNYPLLYSQDQPLDLVNLITQENVDRAIEYLQFTIDKSKFSPEKFLETVKSSSVVLSNSPRHEFPQYDVTISICSYKRTHNLDKILKSLWEFQDYDGKVQIIVWNNNEGRSRVVHDICENYIKKSTHVKSLEVINSTENYFCAIRLALPALMKSDALLICDDDILPEANFISFFMGAHALHPRDVLCLRGHVFLPHALDLENPTNAWGNYEGLRFKGDDAPEQLIHFVHADACLIPKAALRECASVHMPDPSFALVDDYWLGFVLNHKFGRNLRKLAAAGNPSPIQRTDDSDTVGLALHTRPEVQDARVRLYVHHMLQGWPNWDAHALAHAHKSAWIQEKKEFWLKPFIGFNISSDITEVEVQILQELGCTCVRIGAVGSTGIGPGYSFEFCGFAHDPSAELQRLEGLIDLLDKYGISVVLTLRKDLANAVSWGAIASGLAGRKNVVGYDVINEPFTAAEKKMHWTDLKQIQLNGIPTESKIYLDLIAAIREFDLATPIVIEPTFWAHIEALRLIHPKILEADSNLIVSFHFYEPRGLTQRSLNNKKGQKFTFPGEIPIYDSPYSEMQKWDDEFLKGRLTQAKEWAKNAGVVLNLGEFGVCRDIGNGTATNYLQSVVNACVELGLSGFVFSFRDKYWDAMNYEFGINPHNFKVLPEEMNPFMQIIRKGILKMKNHISVE